MAAIIQTVDGVVINRFELDETPLTFGRTSDNAVQIDHLEVSTAHARISRVSGKDGTVAYVLEDLDSTNGSFVNGKSVKKLELRHKDRIRIGLNVFTYIDEARVDIERTTEIKKSWIPGVYYSK